MRKVIHVEDIEIGMEIGIKIKPWLKKRKGLLGNEFEGEVIAKGDKAILFQGSVAVDESSNCRCCGREIKNPISIHVGFGPVCSERLGVKRPERMEDIEETRRKLKERTQMENEEWFPFSQIEEMWGEDGSSASVFDLDMPGRVDEWGPITVIEDMEKRGEELDRDSGEGVNTKGEDPPECPLCDRPFFFGVCSGCGYVEGRDPEIRTATLEDMEDWRLDFESNFSVVE